MRPTRSKRGRPWQGGLLGRALPVSFRLVRRRRRCCRCRCRYRCCCCGGGGGQAAMHARRRQGAPKCAFTIKALPVARQVEGCSRFLIQLTRKHWQAPFGQSFQHVPEKSKGTTELICWGNFSILNFFFTVGFTSFVSLSFSLNKEPSSTILVGFF